MSNMQTIVVLLAVLGQAPPASMPASGELGEPYVDGHYGFSIRPPKGWQRGYEPGGRGRGATILRMLRGISRGLYHEMVIEQTTTPGKRPIGEMLDGLHHKLVLEYNRVELEGQQRQDIAGRPGGVLSATFDAGGMRMFRIHAVVEVRPRHYFELSYTGPAGLRNETEPLFHTVLGSFRLLPERFDDNRIRKALADGAIWLKGVARSNLRMALVPQSVRAFEVDGKTVGFVRMTQAETTRKGRRGAEHAGIAVRERGWTFGEDGSARRLQSDLFLSFDRRFERWKNRITTLVPAEGDRPARLDVAAEDGMRQANVLMSDQSYQLNHPPTVNPPLDLPPAYLSRVVERLLPRLLKNLDTPRLLAFSTFDHKRTDLVFRILDLKGRSDMPTGVTIGKTYRINVYDGLTGEASSLYVDEHGRWLLLRAGKLTTRPARLAEMNVKYAAQIASAERTMNELEKAYRADEQRFGRGG